MKTKKTIRKMAHRPLARELAKLQRSIRSLDRRLTRLVEFADEIEGEGRTLRRTEAELRGRLALAEAPGDDVPLFEAEEAPPLCKCGHAEGEHGTRGAGCCLVNCACDGYVKA